MNPEPLSQFNSRGPEQRNHAPAQFQNHSLIENDRSPRGGSRQFLAASHASIQAFSVGLLMQALASCAVGATGALLVVLAEDFLRLPPSGFAWLIGAIGVGALIGPLIPNTLAKNYRDARWLFVPYVIRGIGDALMATFRSLPIALLLQFVYGLNTSTGMVVFSSTVQGERCPIGCVGASLPCST